MFTGRVVLITGASAGIGAVTAEHFAKNGASVALVGRNVENLNKIIERCTRQNQPKPLAIVADVTIDAERIINSTIDTFNRLDILINNAGSPNLPDSEDISLENYDFLMNINLRSVVHLTKLALPHLIETKGNIVNVSSRISLRSTVGYLVYSMTKAALDQFTKCLSLELAPKGVRVNSVNPGFIQQTSIMSFLGVSSNKQQEFIENEKKTYPIGRVGYPEDVAEYILFLASDKCSFITGTLAPIDGGKQNLC